MAGVHAGKVLTAPIGHGSLRGNFEYAVEAFPFWQSYTPTFQRANCVALARHTPPRVRCSRPYTVGGTFTGVSVTPIILRWNFSGTRNVSFWAQAAGGVLWTNHKYPAFGGHLTRHQPHIRTTAPTPTPASGTSPRRAASACTTSSSPAARIDLGANAVHISSASLGDRNPGVNASLQFTLGYTWWK